MKKIFVVLLIGVSILIASCQAVFTYSPFSFLQRDISTRPVAEQVTRARDALTTGDREQMEEAYAVVAALLEENADDPELNLLAADLAFGASGMTDVFTSALEDIDAIAEGTPEDLAETLESLDIELIEAGVDHVRAAEEAGGEVTETQYVIAGAALLSSAVDQAGGFEELGDLEEGDPGYDDLQDAQEFLEAGNATDLLDLFELDL